MLAVGGVLKDGCGFAVDREGDGAVSGFKLVEELGRVVAEVGKRLGVLGKVEDLVGHCGPPLEGYGISDFVETHSSRRGRENGAPSVWATRCSSLWKMEWRGDSRLAGGVALGEGFGGFGETMEFEEGFGLLFEVGVEFLVVAGED